MLGSHSYFDIRHNWDGRVVSSGRRPHITPKEIPWYSLPLEDEHSPGLPNADRRNGRSKKHMKKAVGIF